MKVKNNLFPIAQEGWKYIAYAITLLLFSAILGIEILKILAFVSIVFFFFVFRNPERELPRFEEKSVLCPVDGVITSIDTIEDTDFSYKITINSDYKDVGILRSPMNASISSYESHYGTRLAYSEPLSQKINENMSIVFESINADKVKIVHSLKQSFCSIKADIHLEQKLVQSARYGLMIHGTTEIYLPQNFRLDVSVSEEVLASDSLIGYFS